MIFGLDYDDTFSADQDLWHRWAIEAIGRGHRVIGVTARNRDQIIEDEMFSDSCETILYCAGHAKYDMVLDLLGLAIDVWIDDKPQYILQSWPAVHGGKYPLDNVGPMTYVPLVVQT